MTGAAIAHVTGSPRIDAASEAIFDVDERHEPLYNPRLRTVRLVTPTPVGQGSVFQAEAGSRRRSTAMAIEFTRFDPPSRLGSCTRMPWMDIGGEVTFEPTSGGTRLHWDWDLRTRGQLAIAAPLVAWLGGLQERRMWKALRRFVEEILVGLR
jgi:hypothetical protein